jgi:hypothetical protein
MISKVISWKFNNQEGMRCKEIDGVMTIVEFPGGIPSQADQDLWTQEYNDFVAAGGLLDKKAPLLDDPQKAFAALMELLWDNSAELQSAFPNPDGKAKFKQAGVAAYRDKL